VGHTYINWLVVAVANMLRCPLTVILAFKSNPRLAASRKKEIRNDAINELQTFFLP
jgi:hypothetical protein